MRLRIIDMDLLRMIAELQDERQRLDEAIEALERLSASSKGRRRGRSARGAKQTDQPLQATDRVLNVHLSKDRKTDYFNP
jgi:hypothetical protein